MTDRSPGMIPYTEDIQKDILANKTARGDHFPPIDQKRVVYSTQPSVTFTAPPAESSDDNIYNDSNCAIHDAITEINLNMQEVVAKNNPPPPPSVPLSVDYDANINTQASPAPVPVNTDRLEAKLRLLTMKYTDNDTVGIFEVQPDIKSILGLPIKVKAEALCNLLKSNSDKLSDSLDVVNRQACWPEQYKFTSWVTYFMYHLYILTTLK